MILFNKLKFLPIILFAVLMVNCSSSVDTSKFTTEEYYNYAYKLYQTEDYEKALQEFQNFVLQFSGSAFYDKAQYYLGMSYYKRKQYLLGAYEFSKLIKNIPASFFVPDAQYMLADSYFQLSPPYQLDQAYSKKAVDEYQAFIDFFPKDPKVADAETNIKILNEKLAQKDFQSAIIYERMDYFKAAIAVAPVTSWRYYDNIYTERYMGTPQNNPAGYVESSPITHASKLKGKFLLIHGTSDDNVQFQNTANFVSALEKANKQFSTMFYPDKNHGIYGGVTRLNLYTLMTNFILTNL